MLELQELSHTKHNLTQSNLSTRKEQLFRANKINKIQLLNLVHSCSMTATTIETVRLYFLLLHHLIHGLIKEIRKILPEVTLFLVLDQLELLPLSLPTPSGGSSTTFGVAGVS